MNSYQATGASAQARGRGGTCGCWYGGTAVAGTPRYSHWYVVTQEMVVTSH